MSFISRRRFVEQVGIVAGSAATGEITPPAAAVAVMPGGLSSGSIQVPLNGTWEFRIDPEKAGEAQGWLSAAGGWKEVTVPHTWQTAPETSDYLGVAWYRKVFDAPMDWGSMCVRVEFEAVYHSATVWLNGTKIGEHLRKGYTAFTCDLSSAVHPGRVNSLVVRVDNAFDSKMLPRDNSYDWTTDGGITRPVTLLISQKTFVERIDVDADPALGEGKASVNARCIVRNTSDRIERLALTATILAEDSCAAAASLSKPLPVTLHPGEGREVSIPSLTLSPVRLWHFDHPNLYRMQVELRKGEGPVHSHSAVFGVRKFETRGAGFYLNGERVRLMGVERMSGSNPGYGMAEPSSWIEHDHHDMKNLNCVFTRVHWQQDRRVLDYCDRHGMLIQVEVPSWGPATFTGMKDEPSAEIMRNGIEQLREMIDRDRNHPSIFAWGLCNEIGGQNPPAFKFAKRLYEEARKLDPRRLRSYASNSLQITPGKDVASLMDFVEWNEYYESWYNGGVESVRKNLEEICRAFPDKPIVISEYGFCECDPKHSGGDKRRIDILRSHTDVYREFDAVGGVIFFCYNDYRTHIGDKGLGVMKQRVHGVVDLYGERKPSYAALRQESAPIEGLEAHKVDDGYVVSFRTRNKIPAYRLDGYRVRWIAYGFGDLPMELGSQPVPSHSPGDNVTVRFTLRESHPRRVDISIVRPTGFSVASMDAPPA